MKPSKEQLRKTRELLLEKQKNKNVRSDYDKYVSSYNKLAKAGYQMEGVLLTPTEFAREMQEPNSTPLSIAEDAIALARGSAAAAENNLTVRYNKMLNSDEADIRAAAKKYKEIMEKYNINAKTLRKLDEATVSNFEKEMDDLFNDLGFTSINVFGS